MNRFAQALEEEIDALERELEAHPAFIKLKALRATRALYLGGAESKAPIEVERGSLLRRRSAPPASGKSLDAVSAVVEILHERGAPLRTSQLMPLIEARGIQFGGNAPQNILSSLLSRSNEVVSKGGHIGWALAEWESTEGDLLAGATPSVDQSQPEAQGREAGPGGGT